MIKKLIFIIPVIFLTFYCVQASQLQFSNEKNLQAGQSLNVSAGQTSGSQLQKINFSISLNQCLLGQTINNFDVIHIKNLKLQAEPGQPLLPVKIIEISLTKNTQITDVRITNVQYVGIKNTLNIAPMPQSNGTLYRINKNIYEKNSYFPGNLVSFTQSTIMNNNSLYIFIYPVQYNPVTKKAILIISGEINIYGD